MHTNIVNISSDDHSYARVDCYTDGSICMVDQDGECVNYYRNTAIAIARAILNHFKEQL